MGFHVVNFIGVEICFAIVDSSDMQVLMDLPDEYMLALTLKCDSLQGKEPSDIHVERHYR